MKEKRFFQVFKEKALESDWCGTQMTQFLISAFEYNLN